MVNHYGTLWPRDLIHDFGFFLSDQANNASSPAQLRQSQGICMDSPTGPTSYSVGQVVYINQSDPSKRHR